jgi:hypothetical protein
MTKRTRHPAPTDAAIVTKLDDMSYKYAREINRIEFRQSIRFVN